MTRLRDFYFQSDRLRDLLRELNSITSDQVSGDDHVPSDTQSVNYKLASPDTHVLPNLGKGFSRADVEGRRSSQRD